MPLLYVQSNLPKAVVADVVVMAGGGLTETSGSGDLTVTLGAWAGRL